LSCIDAPDDQVLWILASLLESENRSDRHFVVIGGDGVDLRSGN
jgi:hypothetical protein